MDAEAKMRATTQISNLKRVLIVSLLIAILSASTRWTVLPLIPSTFTFIEVSAALSALWFALVVISVAKYGKRGVWLLIGAPLVLLWPLVFVLFSWACRHGYECV
jgi:hypothetical protein